MAKLPTRKLTALHHGGVLFLEALPEARGGLEILVDAAKNTAFFPGDEGLGGEIVDTVIKASLDETRVHLKHENPAVSLMVAFNCFSLFFFPPEK